MKLFFQTLLILLPFFSKSQCIASAVNTGDTVFIAADSRLVEFVTEPNRHRQDTLFQTTCKIKFAGKFNFVLSDPDDTTRINIIQKIAASANNLQELTARYLEIMKSMIAEHYRFAKEHNPAEYKMVIDKPVFTTWFLGYENNKSRLISIHFYVNNGVKKPVVVSASTEEPRFDEICNLKWRQLVDPHNIIAGGRAADNSNVERVRHTVTWQTNMFPRQTGGPIDVLIITKAGKKWIQQKNECR